MKSQSNLQFSLRSCALVHNTQGLDEVMIATIIKSTLQALNFIHKNGGIHRDVKVGQQSPSGLPGWEAVVDIAETSPLQLSRDGVL